jgi:hypothetical protein
MFERRNPLSSTARQAGWTGYTWRLNAEGGDCPIRIKEGMSRYVGVLTFGNACRLLETNPAEGNLKLANVEWSDCTSESIGTPTSLGVIQAMRKPSRKHALDIPRTKRPRLDRSGEAMAKNGRVVTSDWEELGWIEIESATCALGDADVVDSEFAVDPNTPASSSVGQIQSAPIVLCGTRADVALPVEVARGPHSEVLAVRLEFVTDLSEIDGDWKVVGEIPLGGRCVALDPFATGSDQCRFEFTVKPGTWVAQYFATIDDVLGIRVVHAQVLAEFPTRIAEVKGSPE